uniref:Cytochrome c-type biogenesis protein CcmF n=1 Tax=Pleurostomum flabellatum TaxID=405751 RepID=A0A7T0M425_9EUKA|nr:cytochrome c-type biogenesis protein CcmF [Pleurostomum flabellatum]QPL15605.1 cytochrome c-type biogenesis protein CcmF [Pleurostomum flabellatum]
MNPVFFFFKEILSKVFFFFIYLLLLYCLLIKNIKYLWLFLLSPALQQKIFEFKQIDIEKNWQFFSNTNDNQWNNFSLLIPNVEINIPLYTSPYLYLLYSGTLLMYITIPGIIFLFIYLFFPIFSKKEKINSFITITHVHLIFFVNWIIVHKTLLPLVIKIIFNVYQEIDLFEFDVEFQVLNYVSVYLKMLYANLSLFLLYGFFFQKKRNNLNILFYFFFNNVLFMCFFPPFVQIYILIQTEMLFLHFLYKYFTFVKKNLTKKLEYYTLESKK